NNQTKLITYLIMTDTKKEGIASDLITEETLENIQHVNNPVMDLPTIEKTYLQEVKSVTKEGNSYIVSDGKARIEVKIISDDIIRVRLAPIGVFLDDFSYAVVEQEHEPHVHEVSEDDKNYHVSTNNVTCTISKK